MTNPIRISLKSWQCRHTRRCCGEGSFCRRQLVTPLVTHARPVSVPQCGTGWVSMTPLSAPCSTYMANDLSFALCYSFIDFCSYNTLYNPAHFSFIICIWIIRNVPNIKIIYAQLWLFHCIALTFDYTKYCDFCSSIFLYIYSQYSQVINHP